ncbi:hypothetical protein CUMW_196360 [Citrus unshiu]|nr:hypothetical protein CUMW_196360 [Citrus unshiu]
MNLVEGSVDCFQFSVPNREALRHLIGHVDVVEVAWKMSCNVSSVSRHAILPLMCSVTFVLFAKKVVSSEEGCPTLGSMLNLSWSCSPLVSRQWAVESKAICFLGIMPEPEERFYLVYILFVG